MRRAGLRTWAFCLSLGLACRTVREVAPPPRGVASAAAEARFHLRDGRLFAATRWSSDGEMFTLVGAGYDAERRPIAAGTYRVRREDIALIERSRATDETQVGGSIAAMSVMTAVSAVGTAACIANPKACFGSCPTFYVATPGGEALQAEGFSSSIARTLESDDLDDLPLARPVDGAIALTMRNEALETHVLRRVALVAVDAPAGSRAYRAFDDETFLAVGATHAADGCDAPAVCPLLATDDPREWTPGSDGVDLAARASLVLRFPPLRAAEGALVLTARNSLMSTYALYQMIALLGRTYGDFLARIERGDLPLRWRLGGFSRALGGLDVSVRQADGSWRRVGSLPYIGPNARATRAVPFEPPSPDAPFEVRLDFARSHWRVDALRAGALTARDLAATEVPAEVVRAGPHDAAAVAASLRGEGERFVAMPGDEVSLRFAVPPARGAPAYLLRTRGYYYEWMREAWLRDENPARARRYLADPEGALRELAAPYHAQEADMDAIFEASRFANPGAR